MQAILAGLALAVAGQLSTGGRYAQEAAPAPANQAGAASSGGSAADAASDLRISFDSLADAEPSAPPPQEAGADAPAAAETSPPTSRHAAPLPFQSPAEPNAPPAAAEAAGADPSGDGQVSVLASQGPKPSEVIRWLMKPPAAGTLSGVPITLSDAVREARSRPDQTQRAQAYWDLSAAVGDHYLTMLEQQELAVLRQGLAAPGPHWAVHQRQAEIRVESTRRAAVAAQLKLHQLLGRPAQTALPLPGDLPHCGRYNAEYEEIFAARPDVVARELSALMPLRYVDLRAQAQALAEAEAWRDEARQQWTSARDDHQLLNAQELVALKRRAFLATARDYNREIAAYTELAAPSEVAPDRLVAMMIRTSTSGGLAFRNPSGVEPASAADVKASNGAVQQAGGADAPPAVADAMNRTLAEGFAAETRRSVRRPVGREHSVLSRIRRLPQRLLDRGTSR